MKIKHIFSLFLCAGLMLSCAKETAFDEEDNAPLRDGYKWLDVSLAMENTKTNISGAGSTKSIEWEQGDKVDFFWGSQTDEKATVTLKTGGPAANLRVQIPVEVTEVYAAYPSGAATFADGTLSFEMPGVESGEFRKVNYLASRILTDSDSGRKTAVFRSVVSFLKFTISDPGAQKIEIKTRAEENPVLRGTIPVTFDTDGNIQIGEVSNTHQTYTMNISGAGDFYAPVLPGKVYTDGFELNYYVNNLNTKYYDVEFDFRLDRGFIANFGTVETLFTDNPVKNYYVTVGGAGAKDGSSWSNALGKDEFKAKITRISDDSDTEVVKAVETYLKNALFHIEGGTYDLGDLVELGFSNHCKKYINFAFDGGYYNGSKDVQNHPTVFDGGNSHRIFALARFADLAVMDCTFSHSSGSGGGQAAIRMDSKYSKLNLSGCSFTDNANTATGGAVNVGFGTASISNCTFSGNTATIGAAININNGGASDIDVTGQVTVTGCTFDGNTTSSTSDGGAVKIQSGGPVLFSGCTFTGNTNTGGYGAAVFVIDAKETLTFTNCAFGVAGNGNTSAKSGGAIRFNNGAASAEFNNCSFADNSTDSFGGAISLAGSFTGTVRINGGSISNCSAPSQEGGAISQDAGTLIVDGLAIDGCSSKYGGAYTTAGGTARFTNCNFGRTSRNTATQRGGCIYSNNGAVASETHTFTDCWISGQVSSGGDEVTGGGARFGSGASPLFTRCTFDNCNSTTTTTSTEQKSGAGAVHIASSHPSFVNCTFSNCSAESTNSSQNGNGGAIKISNSTSHPTFSGCTFTNCEAHYRGGAIYTESSYSDGVQISNCTFTGNYAPDEGAAIDVRAGRKAVITNCTFIENISPWGTVYAGGTGARVDINGGVFRNNEAKVGSTAKTGAAICSGDGTTVRCNGVVFDGNKASTGPVFSNENSNFTAYFNACAFKENNWSDNYGGMMKIAESKSNNVLCLNNCSGNHNYSNGTGKTGQQCTWINLPTNTGVKFVIANTSFIGNLQDRNGNVSSSTSSSAPGIIRIDNKGGATKVGLYMINNILTKWDANTNYGVASTIQTYAAQYCNYNKGYCRWIGGTNEPGGYFDTDGRLPKHFGELAWDNTNNLWTWNGANSGINNLGATADINAAISAADSGFYAWLVSVGAISSDGASAVDARGTTRGTNSWPGSYDLGNK